MEVIQMQETQITSLVQLPLKLIFDDMSYTDIINCSRTPGLRANVKNFYKQDMNLQSLIRLAICETLDDLIRTHPYFITDFEDYFVEMGIPKHSDRQDYRNLMRRFINKFSDSELKGINDQGLSLEEFKNLLTSKTPYEIYDLVVKNNMIPPHRDSKLEYFCEIAEARIEEIYKKQVADFLEDFLYHPTDGFRNTLDLVSKISEQCEEYLLYHFYVDVIKARLNQIELIFCN